VSARLYRLLVVVGLLLGLASFAQAQNKSPVAVPEGTKVMPPKHAEDQPPLDLKAEEQGAFLYVYGLGFLEQDCLDTFMGGPGRLCTLGELIRGVPTPDGRVLGLSVTPVKDTNYTYEILIIGADCVIQAIPRVKGIGGFAAIGTPSRSPSFYYTPNGDRAKGVKLIEMGFEGDGFRRR